MAGVRDHYCQWQYTCIRYQAEGSTVVGCSSRAQSRLSGIVLCSLSGCREHGSRWGQWLGIMPSPRHHRHRLSITFINPVVVRITVFIIFTVWPVPVKAFCSGCLHAVEVAKLIYRLHAGGDLLQLQLFWIAKNVTNTNSSSPMMTRQNPFARRWRMFPY